MEDGSGGKGLHGGGGRMRGEESEGEAKGVVCSCIAEETPEGVGVKSQHSGESTGVAGVMSIGVAGVAG